MFLSVILFVALLAGKAATRDQEDVLVSSRIHHESSERRMKRSLLSNSVKRKPGELFKFVVANGHVPGDAVQTREKNSDPDIFAPVRRQKGNKTKARINVDRSEKAGGRGPGSVFSLFDTGNAGQPTANPVSPPYDFRSEKGSIKKAKSEKKGKGGKGVSSLFMTSAAPFPSLSKTSEPSTSLPPTKAPAHFSPPTSSVPSLMSQETLSPSNRIERTGKGRGKGGKGSKGMKKTAHSSSSKKSNVKRGSEKKRERSEKGKGRTRCSRFEFNIDRRKLQFDGANCGNDFMDVAPMIPELSSFLELVDLAGLSFVFSCAGPFSIAAPVNSAFEGIDLTRFSRRELRDIVLNHIFPGILLESDIQDGVVEALNGAAVITSQQPLRLNDAMPIKTDILGCNFVSHTIDDLLVDLDLRGFQPNNCSPNLIDIARNNSDLSLMVQLLEAAGLEELLSCVGTVTVLMPDNDAINALGSAAIEELFDPTNKDVLEGLLLYHILGDTLQIDNFQDDVDTLLDGAIIEVDRPPLQFNNEVSINTGDINTCNGIIHVIDGVLMPVFNDPTLIPTKSPTVPPTSSPTTQIIAPTAVPSAAPTFDCSDFDFGGSGANCSPNMLELASEDPDLAIVVQLFDASGLAPLFSCAGPFTALFPVNGQEQLQEWLDPANIGELQRLLLYHVLQGETASSDFNAGTVGTLAQDENVLVTVDPLKFDTSGVLSVDDPACNGLLNVIDTVLDPDFTGNVMHKCFRQFCSRAIASATASPTSSPTRAPIVGTDAPSTMNPTTVPTGRPTTAPTTTQPTIAPTTVSPTFLPTISPTSLAPTVGPTTALVTVRVERFLLSFRSTDTTPPTQQQYQDLKLETEAYFEDRFTNKYLGNDNVMFVGIQMNLDFTLEGDDVLDARPNYNIYLEFESAELLFTRSQELPTELEIYTELTTGITSEYLVQYVRTLEGTPFADVQEGYLEYTIDP